MDALKEFLNDQGYYRVKLKKTITNHFEIRAKINGVKGNFILDTGASGSCIGFNDIETFKLNSEESEHKASGAGNSEIDTQIAKKNKIEIGRFRMNKVPLILIDLSHINNALVNHDADPVQGIIGADILHKGKAIIDYGKKYLYLLSKKK
jgi:predicted aspartyl protease